MVHYAHEEVYDGVFVNQPCISTFSSVQMVSIKGRELS